MTSRDEYTRRMQRVQEHIDRHLDAPLDLETLAGVAHFSPFHFHRLFSAWMGETPGDYLRRRRVETAAIRLLAQPRARVLDVALAVGFSSGEAFTRAFRQHYGAAPTAWRTRQQASREGLRIARARDRNSGQVLRKPDQAGGSAAPQDAGHVPHPPEPPMSVRLVELPPVTLACLRHVGPYGAPVLRVWQEHYYPWAALHGLLDRPRYGISHDDPAVTAPDLCRYDACAAVPDGFVATGAAFTTRLAGGRYAALEFEGTNAEVIDAWDALLRDWLPDSGLQLDARPSFEFYPPDAGYDPATGVFECRLCVPVVSL